jgi:hypothetical protein
MEVNMAFVTDKEELKPGLILFRRGDVERPMWYCRMKMPKATGRTDIEPSGTVFGRSRWRRLVCQVLGVDRSVRLGRVLRWL